MRTAVLAGVGLMMVTGCQAQHPLEPPRPPTPTSVSRAQPGGDAPNPEQAALDRLDHEAWGLRPDRLGLVTVPLTDAANWRRVKLWLIPALTGFRYGDQHHGVSVLFVRDARQATTSETCLDEFEEWARGASRQFSLDVEKHEDSTVRWRGQPVLVRRRDGSIPMAFWRKHYAGVYASYPAWPGKCATLAYAFPLDEAAEAGHAARDRFAREAFGRFRPGATVPETP